MPEFACTLVGFRPVIWGAVDPGCVTVNVTALELVPFTRTVTETDPCVWIRLLVTATTIVVALILLGVSVFDPKMT